MRKWIRPAGWIAVAIAGFLMSCSRPVAPVTPIGDRGTAITSSWTAPNLPEPQTARARLRFIGPVVKLDAGGNPIVDRNAEFLIDVDEASLTSPPDTVPALATLKQVRWRVVGSGGDTYVVDGHPVYRPDQPLPASPRLGEFVPGGVIIRLEAPKNAGGGLLAAYFQVNFPPDAWWAGPDPSRFPPASDGDGRAVDVTNWRTFATVPAWPPDGRGFFGPESLGSLPSQRSPRGSSTFYEIWGDRIYARSEGDAVHEGAWLAFSIGGFDRDSPYTPSVTGPAPTLPAGFESQRNLYPLLFDQGLAGSPIGFRLWVPVRDALGGLWLPSETTTFPDFDPASVMYSPQVAGYWRAYPPGKAYAVAFAQDGSFQIGRTPEDLLLLADRVDAGGGSASDRLLRRRVLTFFVRPTEAPRGTTRAGPSGGTRTRQR